MRQISMLLFLIIALSCKEENKQVEAQKDTKTQATTNNNTETKVATNTSTIRFLEDVKSLEKDTSSNPITSFKNRASTVAKEIIKINKDNVKDALAKAKNFKHAVITVENHTIIKIIALDNCKPSGSWSACMPKAEGYIKKGDLIYKNDYVNNIIGLPDDKERLLYLF